MQAAEIAFLVAGYALALRRLLGAARPLLGGLLPDKAQPFVAAGLVILPELAAQLGGVSTKLDLAETLLVAFGAFFTAVRGGQKPPAPPVAPVALLLLSFAVPPLTGCSAKQEPPPCDPVSYAALAASCGDDAAECDRQIEERETFCAKRIEGEP